MEVLSNLTKENHLHHLHVIFEEALEITVISPFITDDPNLFRFERLPHLRKLTFVTTLKAFDKDQYSKVRYFKYLYQRLNALGITFSVLIENSLHGKIFVAEYDNQQARAIITSANFTHNGLRLNNEWGILVTDSQVAGRVKKGVLDKVLYKELDESVIDACLKQIAGHPIPKPGGNTISLDLTFLLEEKGNYYGIGSKATYWLKPIGVSGNPISKDRAFDTLEEPLHFSKLKPKGVKVGDILICYAVGHQNILSVYRVKSGILNTGDPNDRWPNYVIGENLTPFYGGLWIQYNIKATNQRAEVLNKGLFNITPSGKNSYGSLNRGADKLRITTEFGEYLLSRVSTINRAIEESQI
ncbi:restriction endonuclease PLD domain-containing protein [Flavobacterium sp. RHBU_3]|uniref:restriction endonuclease PLD domain-containing protein n=1 Tax=Flavobacterium sp. RHBU_3 TaxID=3391184 RepID=UPI0039852115